MISHTLQEMSIDSIVPSKDNARHINEKSQSFLDIKESIKASGVQEPIHVWPHPKREGKYEIRAGERRWRACKSLKYKMIPAIVHRGISIQDAMLLTVIENKFHDKLEPLEEVEEIARFMDHLKSDAKLIATLIGQTEQWVRLRANIHKNLVQAWRQAFPVISLFKKWSVGHLTLIARLPANIQKELLTEIKKYYWRWENVSVQDLERRIGESLMLLTKAKWDLDDDTLLPKAGSCSKCIKRSAAEPVLWFGAIDNQIRLKDRCLDPQCWMNKMKIYLQRRSKQLLEKHSNLVYIATDQMSGNEKEDLSKEFGRILDQYDVQKSTKNAKGSIPALIVHGKGTGTVIYIREKWITGPAGARQAGKPTPLKQRREMLKAKRWAQVLTELRKKVKAAGVDQVIFKDKITGIIALAAFYGNTPFWSLEAASRSRNRRSSNNVIRKRIDELVKKAECKRALEYLWASVKPTLEILINYGGPVTKASQFVIDNAKWIAKLIQVDIDKMFKEVSKQKGFTEPKSWKNLNEDGTHRR